MWVLDKTGMLISWVSFLHFFTLHVFAVHWISASKSTGFKCFEQYKDLGKENSATKMGRNEERSRVAFNSSTTVPTTHLTESFPVVNICF